MTKQEFLTGIERTFAGCLEIARRKNDDYAGVTGADPFANFEAAPALLSGVTAEKAILIRMTDKLKRLDNLLSQPNFVTEESFGDTCDDLINYAVILKLYRRTHETESGVH